MRLDIKYLVDKKFQNKNQFAKAIGVGYPAACKLYDGDTSKINFDTLENLCIVLECTPSDLFESDDKRLNRLLQYYKALTIEKDDTK
jgi:putative transcriptional regulator|nr:MAG TPA: Cro/C1-type HTH DNA-binding domain protein [Caudoviricetes sp.]